MFSDKIRDCDVLVIGGGGAGARAAIEAKRYDANVILVDKGLFSRNGCTRLAGGINAAIGHIDARDTPDLHFKDTIEAGAYLNNQRLTRILVDEVPGRLAEVEGWGAIFDRQPNGKLKQQPGGGMTYPRYVTGRGDAGGGLLIKTLKDKIYLEGVEVINNLIITNLLTDDRKVVGATGLKIDDGSFIVIKSKAIIIATGSGCELFPLTSNPAGATGDGFILAYKAGCELLDMEMIQFHPTGICFPGILRGLIGSEVGFFGALGAIMINKNGERFMSRYDPVNMEHNTRDVISRCEYMEIRAGRGTKNGGIYLDLRPIPLDTRKNYIPKEEGEFYELCLDAGVDFTEEPLEIAPSAHYFMGGLKIDEKCSTNILGLYGAGGVAGGIQGANRVRGNSLAELLVFGARAGEYAAKYAKTIEKVRISEDQVKDEKARIYNLLENKNKEIILPITMKRKLQELAWKKIGVVRNKKDLQEALLSIAKMKEDSINLGVSNNQAKYNLEWVEAIEVLNLLKLAEIISKAALCRTESRGSHYREDHPKRDDVNWMKHVVIKKDGVETIPVEITEIIPPGGS
jgi:fumarate reductase (CoM/CoB) subunit A